MTIKQVAGIYLPEKENHLIHALEQSSTISHGRGFYQLHTLSHFLDHVPGDRRRRVLDIGGHVGLWSMHLAKVFDKVEAFEPIPVLQECFEKNVLTHPEEARENVTLHRYALGSSEGTARLVFEKDNSGHTHIAPDLIDITNSREDFIYSSVMPLDNIPFDTIDAIKIDVEGFELQVLLGAKETLLAHKPILCIEQKPHKFYAWHQFEALKYLKEMGAVINSKIVDDYIVSWPED